MTINDNARDDHRLGVGFAGAGAVVQAIHLPTLARMPDLFSPRHVMDADPQLAARVAEAAGARVSSSMDDLLADDEVDVVVVGSPPRFHAEQVLAAIDSGKKAVLCEKPFADSVEDARRVAEASIEAGVPVVVGAMHTFDPAWLAAREHPEMQPGRVHAIRSRIVLPPNPLFEDAAADVIRPDVARAGAGTEADMMRGMVLGLAIHDLPLIRELVGREWSQTSVVAARALRPKGYVIDLSIGTMVVQLIGGMGTPGEPEWTMDVIADDADVHVSFPPSYVHVGSAEVLAVRGDRAVTVGPFAEDGYDAEWRHVHAAVADPYPHLANVAGLADDLEFAIGIADGAVARLAEGERA